MHAARLIQYCLTLACCITVTCCGFHLQGQAGDLNVDTRLQQLAISGAQPLNQVALALQRQAQRAGIILDEQALVRIEIKRLSVENRRLSASQGADIDQYRLSMQTQWQLYREQQLYLPKPVKLARDYDYQRNNLLSNEQEQETIRRELAEASAKAILRQAMWLAANPPDCGTCNHASDTP